MFHFQDLLCEMEFRRYKDGIITVGEVERYNLFDVIRLYLYQGHDARRRRDFFPYLYRH